MYIYIESFTFRRAQRAIEDVLESFIQNSKVLFPHVSLEIKQDQTSSEKGEVNILLYLLFTFETS